MPVEEVLVEYRVVVGQRLGQPRQPRGRDLLEGGLVRLVPNATHVDDDAVLGVGDHRRRHPRRPVSRDRHLRHFAVQAPVLAVAVRWQNSLQPYVPCESKKNEDIFHIGGSYNRLGGAISSC